MHTQHTKDKRGYSCRDCIFVSCLIIPVTKKQHADFSRITCGVHAGQHGHTLDLVKRCVLAKYETRYHVPYNVQDWRNLERQEEKGLQAHVMSDNLENNASLLRSQLIQAALHSGMRTRVGIPER